ncbi:MULTISPECIES: DEAD/DEAH box helicase family protein [Vibrio]|uniref:DEAD/DEAH box helicase family protein n=1 Tax=Vibrio anguillarum TaxID=55601 RepID=A0ABD4QRA7_VIBAN|nr:MULTISPECIES: DEAD/DEAH box helicase family protein [Vibrio]MBT2917747.1 DEAD/DEAH box helicase family protein [Vibrio anguillarum]MDQ2190589.1 DEAD/DEAH box helicase [Vibrio sp. A14(2019)]MDQ2196797.1 DEAD/DEAH box helicase [Vibrio sp. 2017_1457_11]NNN75360.1 DEAD/DEAH box helicase [Vibrio sp. B7]NNN92065.1 DEAD/DEAH box helicase [Vibrio sp. B8-1]
MLDFSQLGGTNPVDSSFNPREIFQALPKVSGKFQYPRDVQSQVWAKWYERRDTKNLVIKMNTGGGKTSVGLLVLKSCLNERKGPAVYVVPDNYLVDQVILEAKELGINTTKNPHDHRYLSSNSILVINIHKLVNGRSVFGVGDEGIKVPIGSIIIDDAHACLDTVDQQFTMEVPSTSPLYNELRSTFDSVLEKQSYAKYHEILSGDTSAFLQVPFWSWQKQQAVVTQTLVKHKSDRIIEFSYPLLKSHLQLANCVFSASKVEISPHFIPISVIPALGQATRKIFMTATLADDSILSSHFGVNPNELSNPITPDSAGDVGDRMILLPQVINPKITDEDIQQLCKSVSKKHNVVVITPSTYRAQQWENVSDLTLNSSNISEGVARLKTQHVGLVVLNNRYDGIDLPQTACRLLVIDGLPDARNLIDRVKQSSLMSSNYDNVEKIQRIEQGMGRGVRSSDDYCVVLLTGKGLTSTIYTDNAIENFSPATRAQMNISESVTAQVTDKPASELEQLMDYCLLQNQQWVGFSKGQLAQLTYDERADSKPIKLSLYDAYLSAIRGDVNNACRIIEATANACDDNALKGYLKQVLAEYTNINDETQAQLILLNANIYNQRLLKPLSGLNYSKINNLTQEQAEQCSSYLNSKFLVKNKMIITANAIIDDLFFKPKSANKFEAAMNDLAKMLGFNSQRPELAYNKGPDNLWSIGNQQYLVIECKNEATSDTINKSYCNQLNGSSTWFETQYDFTSQHTPIMIHPSVTFEYASSPKPTIRIINEQKLQELRQNALSFFEAISTNNEINNVDAIREKLATYKLRGQDMVECYTVPFRV